MRTIVLCIATMAGLGRVTAQEARPPASFTDVEAAVAYAMTHNPDRALNALDLEQARIEHQMAKSSRMPRINGSFSGQKNTELATTPLPGELAGQPGETIEVQFGQKYNYSAGILIDKSLLDMEAFYNGRVKKQDLGMRGLEHGLFDVSLKSRTVYAYYAALVAGEARAIAVEDRAVADSILRLTQRKFDEGLVDRSTLNKAKVNRNRIAQSHDEALLVYRDAEQDLREVLGLGPEDSLELMETIGFDQFTPAPAQDLGIDLEERLADERRERARISLQQARAGYLPKLGLTHYIGSQLFSDEFDFSISDERWAPVRYVGLDLTVPIFNGLTARRTVKLAKLETEMAAINYDKERDRLAGQDRLLLENHALTASIASANLENYRLYSEITDLEFRRYSEGVVGLDGYLAEFEGYLDAKNAYLNALINHYQFHAQVYARNDDRP